MKSSWSLSSADENRGDVSLHTRGSEWIAARRAKEQGLGFGQDRKECAVQVNLDGSSAFYSITSA